MDVTKHPTIHRTASFNKIFFQTKMSNMLRLKNSALQGCEVTLFSSQTWLPTLLTKIILFCTLSVYCVCQPALAGCPVRTNSKISVAKYKASLFRAHTTFQYRFKCSSHRNPGWWILHRNTCIHNHCSRGTGRKNQIQGLKGFHREGKHVISAYISLAKANNMATSFFKGAEKYILTMNLKREPGLFFFFFTALMPITRWISFWLSFLDYVSL